MTSSITRFILSSRSHLLHTVLLESSFLFLYIHTMSIRIIFILTSYLFTLYLFPLCHLLTPYYSRNIIHTISLLYLLLYSADGDRPSPDIAVELRKRFKVIEGTYGQHVRVVCTHVYSVRAYEYTVHVYTYSYTHAHTHAYTQKNMHTCKQTHSPYTHAHSSCMHHTHHTL
jgi:hypothetical protein